MGVQKNDDGCNQMEIKQDLGHILTFLLLENTRAGYVSKAKVNIKLLQIKQSFKNTRMPLEC
jgi:hypothetical protein